jgi:hypothetical protein
MTFDAHILRQAMPVFASRTLCAGAALRDHPSGMGVMTGDACHFPVFVQRQANVVFYFYSLYAFQPIGRGPDSHMVGISGMVPCDVVASAAQQLDIADQDDVLESGVLFIRFFQMAEEAGVDDNLTALVQLLMGIGLFILLQNMAIMAEIYPSGIGRTAK